MIDHHIGEIKYHTFASFDDYGLHHAMIARHGGVSSMPWDTLNLGSTVGDPLAHVNENINRVCDSFNIDRENIYDVWQVHSDRVVCTNMPRKQNIPHQKADAIITNQQGLTLMMRFADCVPILLFDTQKKVIGIAHAGWKGTIQKIVIKTVQAMIEIYRSNPGDIIAGIGPSIACHHYEVGKEVVQEVRKAISDKPEEFLISKNGSTFFDLWGANQKFLESTGIHQIENIGICTACNIKDWFSHRGEKGRSGRFGVFIRL
jgi:hypothetical protein